MMDRGYILLRGEQVEWAIQLPRAGARYTLPHWGASHYHTLGSTLPQLGLHTATLGRHGPSTHALTAREISLSCPIYQHQPESEMKVHTPQKYLLTRNAHLESF